MYVCSDSGNSGDSGDSGDSGVCGDQSHLDLKGCQVNGDYSCVCMGVSSEW